MQRGPARPITVVGAIEPGATIKQAPCPLRVATQRGHHQRGFAGAIGLVDAGLRVVEQRRTNFETAIAQAQVKRRLAFFVDGIRVEALGQQALHLGRIVGLDGLEKILVDARMGKA